MNKTIKLTKSGLSELQKEYDTMVSVKRPAIVARVSNAREQGDLSENSDYTNAREELEFLDGKIDEIKHVLDHAEIIDEAKTSNGGVAVGTKVKVSVNGTEHMFDIVGDWEADPVQKKISHSSPLGEALVGKKPGEEVEVEAPAGKIIYKVISVE